MATEDGENLRQAVFGANDGLVSTFGLVAGLIGAGLPQGILVLANIVNMIAGGMSMGLGSYLATKSQRELNEKLRANELNKIRTQRSKAEAELLFLLREQGIPARELKHHSAEIMQREEDWLEFIMDRRHGLAAASFPNPIKGGAIMFIVFILCGLVPIAPLFFLTGGRALVLSAILTAIALFFVGALKQKFTGRTFFSLGMENLLIGAITGSVGFIAGSITASLMA